MKDIIDKITSNEAILILKRLAESDETIKNKINEIAYELIGQVDYEKICESVFDALIVIDIHELWAGAIHGYIPTEDMAAEIFEEKLEPFKNEMFRLIDLKMEKESMYYCMGILKGINKYVDESDSEFKDWAEDVPDIYFEDLLYEWKKKITNKTIIEEMTKFIEKEFGD